MVGDFITYVLGQTQVIAQAPIAFATALIVCGVLIWLFLRSRYDREISLLNERIKLRDDQLGDLQNRLKADSPNDALRKVTELQAKVEALSVGRWDLLTEQQKGKMHERLGGLARAHVMVAMTNDAKPLALSFARIFRELGWEVDEDFFLGHVSGLYVSPPSEAATAIAQILQTEAGLPIEVKDHPSGVSAEKVIVLGVGDRPY
jgi:hypothetical protein